MSRLSDPDTFEAREAVGAERDFLMSLVDNMRAVSSPPHDVEQVQQWLGMAITAAAITAGAHFGTLASIGVVNNDRGERHRVEQMLVKNFRSGIDITLRMASRIAKEQGFQQ